MCLQWNLVVCIGQLSLKCANFERNVDNGCLLFFKKVFGKSAQARKLMELDFLGRFSGRFPGATGHLKR